MESEVNSEVSFSQNNVLLRVLNQMTNGDTKAPF